MRGKFIVVEGIRGSGKTTLIKEIQKEFTLGYVQDMGATKYCLGLRDLLLLEGVHPLSRLAVSMAAKVELQRAVIEPALEAGENVICERWYQSAEAYILYPNGIGPEVSVNARNLFHILEPDLVVIRSMDWADAQERLKGQGRPLNVFEENEEHMRKVSDFYNGYCRGLLADTLEVGLGHLRYFLSSLGAR